MVVRRRQFEKNENDRASLEAIMVTQDFLHFLWRSLSWKLSTLNVLRTFGEAEGCRVRMDEI